MINADIQWHAATIRFGPQFTSHASHDRWVGKVSLIADLYDLGLCHLYALSVKSEDGRLTMKMYRDVLRLCAKTYKRASQTREVSPGVFYRQEMDLTVTPFRWVNKERIT